ncbi:RNA polymerase II C-terminal domain kinase beta subunit [Dispira simplex]|nr:RNA polymerase II C-terminal domain kinase beta subunit [Dispira simplex]
MFLACKAEETVKKLRDIILAAHTIIFPEKDILSANEHEIELVRADVIRCEAALLEMLNFCFDFPHPHPLVIKFGKCLKVDKALVARAWKIATECYQTNLPLRFPPHTVAAGALYLASKVDNMSLNGPAQPSVSTTSDNRPWFVQLGSRLDDIHEFSNHMIDFYIAST